MMDLSSVVIFQDTANAFIGFLTDMYTPTTDGQLPIVAALAKQHRYLYLSLLGIVLLIVIQLLERGISGIFN